jgi:hypothetical protein
VNLVLERNFNLTSTNWADVSGIPSLNLTILRYELTVPATNSRCFYRLAGH